MSDADAERLSRELAALERRLAHVERRHIAWHDAAMAMRRAAIEVVNALSRLCGKPGVVVDKRGKID